MAGVSRERREVEAEAEDESGQNPTDSGVVPTGVPQ